MDQKKKNLFIVSLNVRCEFILVPIGLTLIFLREYLVNLEHKWISGIRESFGFF